MAWVSSIYTSHQLGCACEGSRMRHILLLNPALNWAQGSSGLGASRPGPEPGPQEQCILPQRPSLVLQLF